MRSIFRSVPLYLIVCLLATSFADEIVHDSVQEGFNSHVENNHHEEVIEHKNHNLDNIPEHIPEQQESHNNHQEFTHVENTHHDTIVENKHHDTIVVENTHVENTHHDTVVENTHHDTVVENTHHDTVVENTHHDAVVENTHHDAVVKNTHHDAGNSVDSSHHAEEFHTVPFREENHQSNHVETTSTHHEIPSEPVHTNEEPHTTKVDEGSHTNKIEENVFTEPAEIIKRVDEHSDASSKPDRVVSDLKHELDLTKIALQEEKERREHEISYYSHQLDLAHEKVELEEEKRIQELADVKHQLAIEKDLVFELESKLERSQHNGGASGSLESLRRELTNCKDELLDKHHSTATIVRDLKHELNQKHKESSARILELESESGFCSAPPPDTKSKSSAAARKNRGESPAGTSVGSNVFGVFSIVGSSVTMAYNVLISPITTIVTGASSSVYQAVHPIAHGAGSHVGKQWNKIVVPPYRSHVEPHVSKVTGSIQGTYNTHMKRTVDTYIEPIHAFAWDRMKGATYTVFDFFRGDGFLERVAELPRNIFTVLSAPYMTVVSSVSNSYGMKLVFGKYSDGASMFIVTVTTVTLSYLFRRLLFWSLTAFVFVLLSPFTFAIFVVSRGLGISSGGKKALKPMNLHIDVFDHNAHHSSQENLNYHAPLSSVRPAMSSDQWGLEQPMNYYGADANHIPDSQHYSPPMNSTIRASMSVDRWNRDGSASNTHIAAESPRYSPMAHVAPTVRHSMSSEQWSRDDQSTMYPGHDAQRHQSMPPSAPMMNGDQWNRSEPIAPYYNNNSASQPVTSPTNFPNFAFKGQRRQSVHEDDYEDNA
jgi:hypothetical protein